MDRDTGELVPVSSPVPVEEDLVARSPGSTEEAVSPTVGDMPNAVVTLGDTAEVGEEDPGPALLLVTGDSDQGPPCLDEVPWTTKLVPRSTVVFLRSDVRVTPLLVSAARAARR